MTETASTRTVETDQSQCLTTLTPPVKGKSDWRNYRPLKLPNGTTCLLVNDRESKTTAMAVCVGSGASADPREFSGLAHFTEHMCFLGSEAYPGENEYKRYLSRHGGRSNASTAMGNTTYKFDVLAQHAEGAVDIFSNFFVSPLFTPSGTGREVQAVHSENSKNLTSDARRRLQILKALADPTHHYSKFSTGNAKTLPAASASEAPDEDAAATSVSSGSDPAGAKNDREGRTTNTGEGEESVGAGDEGLCQAERVREAMLAFHRRHYRPDNMTAVIVGPQSLDELQAWVVPRFAAIRDQWDLGSSDNASGSDNDAMPDVERLIDAAAADAPPESHEDPPPPYDPAFRSEVQGGTWPVQLTTLPLKSMRRLVLLFPVPSVLKVPDRSPIHFLSHLLGHEGPGSSFAVLQDAGLVSSLSVGPRISAADQCLLQINVALTELGEARWEEVVATIFAHCRLIHNAAVVATQVGGAAADEHESLNTLKRIWKEMADISAMHFHQTSPGQAYSFAPSLAQSVRTYGIEGCLSAGCMLREEEETLPLDAIVDFSSRLVPSNCIVERCSQSAWEEQQAANSHGPPEVSVNGVESPPFGLKSEQWYGVEYYLTPIDASSIASWQEGTTASTSPLHLPEPNRYIPRSLELCDELPDDARLGPRIDKDIKPPTLAVQHEFCGKSALEDLYPISRIPVPNVCWGVPLCMSLSCHLLRLDSISLARYKGRLWHRLDDRYALPKSSLTLLMRSPGVQHAIGVDGVWSFDHDASIKSLMLVSAFNDAQAQDTYDADLAGLGWSLSKSALGITLRCSGYSDRLADLASKLLKSFLLPGAQAPDPETAGKTDPSFLQDDYFIPCKDRIVRNLKSYFQSSRADSLAMYYMDLLLSSNGTGVETSLSSAERVTLESLCVHHRALLSSNDIKFECLFTGNVSQEEAESFFSSACDTLQEAKKQAANAGPNVSHGETDSNEWIPGPFERRLNRGEDVLLHFQSKNPEEENGAVLMAFQSGLAGYRGDLLSSPESLRQSAALRLICHMLREPLFDELRTKQQLGYVVSSYFDVAFSTKQQDSTNERFRPSTVPIDSIVVNILSRKAAPVEVARRVDEFLRSFRTNLETVPTSEIDNHSDALSKKLLKPIQKLGDEVTVHFGKIQRYGPEVLDRNMTSEDLPWDSVKTLAHKIQSLDRSDLLDVWDNVVANKERARIVSHVYGKSFPMPDDTSKSSYRQKGKTTMVNNLNDLFATRSHLSTYSDRYSNSSTKKRGTIGLLRDLSARKRLGLAVAVLGAGTVAYSLWSKRSQKEGEASGGIKALWGSRTGQKR